MSVHPSRSPFAATRRALFGVPPCLPAQARKIALPALIGLLAACGGGAGDAPAPAPAPTPAPIEIGLRVADPFGRPVADAAVRAGNATATTDANGRATLAAAPGSTQVVAVAKDGHVDQLRVLRLGSDVRAARLHITLLARNVGVDITDVQAGGNAAGPAGARVELPANALVDANGAAVTGTVRMALTPIDASGPLVRAVPGEFEGTDATGARTLLASFGATDFTPMQGGRKVQLAPGKTATIEMPLFARKTLTGSALAVGDTLPFWSLATATGLWRQEGSGTVVASAESPTGLALRASVTHFSPYQPAHAVPRRAASVNVAASGVPPSAGPQPCVILNSTSPPGSTFARYFRQSDCAGSTINAGNGGTDTTIDLADVATVSGTVDVSAEASLTTVNLDELVCVSASVPAGTLMTIALQCDALGTTRLSFPNSTTYAGLALGRQIGAGGLEERAVLDPNLFVAFEIDGGLRAGTLELFANATLLTSGAAESLSNFFPTSWDTRSFAPGDYQLTARLTSTNRGGSPVTTISAPVHVVIDHTPPQATAVSPDASVQVDRSTVFTLDFSEPVSARQPSLPTIGGVTLSVLQAGQTTSTPIAADVRLENLATAAVEFGTRVVVRPLAALPAGVATLDWSGLEDIATNPMGGARTQSWTVFQAPVGPAATPVGPALPTNNFVVAMTLAASSTGVPYALRWLPNTVLNPNGSAAVSDVAVARYDAATDAWQQVGPKVNELPASEFQQDVLALALDANDVPIAAVRETIDFVASQHRVVVRRFDAAANAWVVLGTPFGASFNTDHVRLRVDALNRPVLAFSAMGQGNRNVRVHRFEGASWNALAALPGSDDQQLFDLAVAPGSGEPVVLYAENTVIDHTLRVAEFNGVDWTSRGSPGGATFQINQARLEADGSGRLWVLFVRNNLTILPADIVVLESGGWRGAAFPAPVAVGNGLDLDLAVFNGDPVAAICNGTSGPDIYRFRNGAWEAPFTVPGTCQSGDNPILAAGGRNLFVSRVDGPVNARTGRVFGLLLR